MVTFPQGKDMLIFKFLWTDARNMLLSQNTHVLDDQNEDNLFSWNAFIVGPPDSSHSIVCSQLSMSLQRNCSLSPPKLVFITQCVAQSSIARHPDLHNISLCEVVVRADPAMTRHGPRVPVLQRFATSCCSWPSAS